MLTTFPSKHFFVDQKNASEDTTWDCGLTWVAKTLISLVGSNNRQMKDENNSNGCTDEWILKESHIENFTRKTTTEEICTTIHRNYSPSICKGNNCKINKILRRYNLNIIYNRQDDSFFSPKSEGQIAIGLLWGLWDTMCGLLTNINWTNKQMHLRSPWGS